MMELKHHKLTGITHGCMYASLYALTGDEALLDTGVLNDLNSARFQIRVSEQGYMLHPVYVDPFDTCKPEVWKWLWRQRPTVEGGYIPMVITIPSQQIKGSRHMVAGILDWEGVMWISDSNRDGIIEYKGLDNFLLSYYAPAYEIEQLASPRLDDHQFDDAEVLLAETR